MCPLLRKWNENGYTLIESLFQLIIFVTFASFVYIILFMESTQLISNIQICQIGLGIICGRFPSFYS